MSLKSDAKYLVLRQRLHEDWGSKDEQELAEYISQQVYTRCDLTVIRNRIQTVLAVNGDGYIQAVYKLVGLNWANGHNPKINQDFTGYAYQVAFDKELANKNLSLIGKRIFTPSSLPVRTLSDDDLANEMEMAKNEFI